MDVLEARGLEVSFGAAKVLRDVSFTLRRGRVLGLVGESGAGKSMLGRVIARNLPEGFAVTGGALSFLGQDLVTIADEPRRQLLGDKIAFIPQEPLTALNPVMTVGRQFDEHLARLGAPRAGRRERAIAALAELRLRDPASLLERYPFQLSGGMCQRVLIAMAFASGPALIVADEPTTALDVSTQAHIVQIVRALQRDHGTTLLFITHDLRLASHVCDDILVLYAGEVVERGPAREVCAAPRHPYTRALLAANPPLDGAARRLVTLPDTMPGLAAFASLPGCRFAPRCPVKDPACAAATPPLRDIAPGRAVRCTEACLTGAAAIVDAAPPRPPAPPPGETVLALETVSKHYPGERDWLGRRRPGVDAVKPLDLTVRAGEFVGVVGESGSGKSTLAKLVMGLEAATGGRIAVDGKDVTVNDPAARRVRLGALQMVFQDPQSALNPRRPVSRLITQAMEAGDGRWSEAERVARARALLEETGLSPDLLGRYPSQLSGGQKQRVNIARALCVTPRLLVADEIVSGLDVSVQAQILNLLLDLRRERGIGLVFISHDLAVVRYLCDRVVVMRHGEVVESGDTDTVFAAPRHPYTRALLAAVPPEDPDRPWPPEPGPAA
ncbi:ABC transporter ATP-binding protein [Alsobacter sp. SYSU M60028]|uniref:ABC transporter ATP-binding protein n=1 Tax=Alsobacter ponti TaxID=2962936 RepID=A0ABT1LAH2_9HYPH|nr:ABC transporter ATP-binding protein [Alsobacter ponti]MCP8937943.1 ABC transporter ATP-binding protein [Alsobacter ponti]